MTAKRKNVRKSSRAKKKSKSSRRQLTGKSISPPLSRLRSIRLTQSKKHKNIYEWKYPTHQRFTKRLQFTKREKIFLMLTVVSIFIAFYALFGRFFGMQNFLLKEFGKSAGNIFISIPDMSTAGYKMVSVDVAYDDKNGVVSLTSGCKRIIAYVERAQAESIYRGIKDIFIARPNAHDIMVDTLENLDIEVVMVKVTELKDNAFYGKIILRQGNKILSLDARPSDATAIAVRTNAPVYLKSDLLESQGEDIC